MGPDLAVKQPALSGEYDLAKKLSCSCIQFLNKASYSGYSQFILCFLNEG